MCGKLKNKVGIKEKVAFDDDLHTALRPVLVIAQCFAIMPVSGVFHSDSSQLRFRWCSLRTVHSLLYICGGIFIDSIFFRSLVPEGIGARNIVGGIFFTCAVIIGVLFLLMARRWHLFVHQFLHFESTFLQPPYYLKGWRLRTKLRLVAFVILACALVEHILYLSSNIYTIHQRVVYCGLQVTSVFDYFAENTFGFVYKVVPYNMLVFATLEIINIAFTFGWNYIDLFIIMLSLTLITRFGQIHARLEAVRGRVMPESYWHEARLHFVTACELLEFLDRSIGKMIVLSSINNLYFVCFQLLNIYKQLPHTIAVVYFWFSLGYLITRTAMVFIAATNIHEATKKPVVIFRALPTSGWCVEAERFCMQVTNEEIALTGMGFFTLTRSMILTMAAMIITYELVLLQFDGSYMKSENVTICDF